MLRATDAAPFMEGPQQHAAQPTSLAGPSCGTPVLIPGCRTEARWYQGEPGPNELLLRGESLVARFLSWGSERPGLLHRALCPSGPGEVICPQHRLGWWLS